jgi:hypothetical protein
MILLNELTRDFFIPKKKTKNYEKKLKELVGEKCS